MLEMDLVNLKVHVLIPRIFFWLCEKLRGLSRRGEILQGDNRLMAFCGIRHCYQCLRSTVTLGKDRSMLVATGSTDDEAIHDFKVQVQNHRRHAVLE